MNVLELLQSCYLNNNLANCNDFNKWQVISVPWSNRRENLSSCWSDGEQLITFTTGDVKGSDYCHIGDFGKLNLTACICEIVVFHETLKD